MRSPPSASGLVPEYFQLVQAAVYHADGLWGEATFDLYVKEAPEGWGYLVAAGVEAAVEGVLGTRFDAEGLAWLRQQPHFSSIGPVFFEDLAELRFDGDIDAVPEGTVVFPGEPVLRLTAPLPHAGLFEAGLIQLVSQATGIATRASRLVQAARGRPVLDFGSRRAPGPAAAWHAARAAWLGGCAGTTNAGAAAELQIPVVGVMSDSIVASYDGAAAAWRALRQHAPLACELNLPAGPIGEALDRLTDAGEDLRAVRVDHPDLLGAASALRRELDQRGLRRTRILGSGSLDEVAIEQLLRAGAPVDELGVGGALVAGRPPAMSYRIAELTRGIDREPVTGTWSAPWPGRKQVLRFPDRDLLCDELEAHALAAGEAQPLLVPWVRAGARVRDPEPLVAARARRAEQVSALPPAVRQLELPDRWPVEVSERLRRTRG